MDIEPELLRQRPYPLIDSLSVRKRISLFAQSERDILGNGQRIDELKMLMNHPDAD